MKVLVAMSGGVDSSVAAALLAEDGHQVVGATMKLWGGRSDSGCCSVADVEDARLVAQSIGIRHYVFNFTEEFDRHVVDPYVAAHAAAQSPNPCIECNRHLKFDRLFDRARVLGFDAVATGHHARIERPAGQPLALLRGVDAAKDQSYVLYMLGQRQLARTLLPIGGLTKVEVREKASMLGLRTAAKPDSQDVCFISRAGGRGEFLGSRIPLRAGTVVDQAGHRLGEVPAVELVTVGQRRGLGAALPREPDGPRYVLSVDPDSATVTVGPPGALLVDEIRVRDAVWVGDRPGADEDFEVQTSAHGRTTPARWSEGGAKVILGQPVRRVAPGQSVVLYRGDAVVGGGIAVSGP